MESGGPNISFFDTLPKEGRYEGLVMFLCKYKKTISANDACIPDEKFADDCP